MEHYVVSEKQTHSGEFYEKVPFVLKTYWLCDYVMNSCSLESCTMSSEGRYIMSTPSVPYSVISLFRPLILFVYAGLVVKSLAVH